MPDTSRIAIRRTRVTDATAILAIRQDPITRRYQPMVPGTLAGLRTALAERAARPLASRTSGKLQWTIEVDGRIAGWITLDITSREHGIASVGYSLAPAVHGQGIMPVALSRVVPIAFDPAGLAADAFVECSGATPAVLAGLDALRPGGTAVLVGLGAESMPIPVQTIMNKEIVLTGVFRYVDTWPKAIAAAMQPGIDLDALVTGEFELEDAEAALTSDADPGSMKSIVVVSR